MSYLDQNLDQFNTGKFAVAGTNQAMVMDRVIHAVYYFYSQATPEQLKNPPTPDFIKQVVNDSFDKKFQ